MKIYTIITKTLDRFRKRSMRHPMAFYWTGNSMILHQNGSKFNIREIFAGSIMPKTPVKGLILPGDLNNIIEVQQYLDDNIEELMITPAKWGYDIYKISSEGPQLVKELRFCSVRNKLVLFFAKFWDKDIRIALKNVDL